MTVHRTLYERVFEAYLRRLKLPYVAVEQARRAMLPTGAKLSCTEPSSNSTVRLKSFDFVVYGQRRNLLSEIKGRRLPARKPRKGQPAIGSSPPAARLESWTTLDDVESLAAWQTLFGPDFEAHLVFIYRLDRDADPSGFSEWFEHESTRYVVLGVPLDDYRAEMKTRSPRWRTVDLPTRAMERLARPLTIGADRLTDAHSARSTLTADIQPDQIADGLMPA